MVYFSIGESPEKNTSFSDAQNRLFFIFAYCYIMSKNQKKHEQKPNTNLERGPNNKTKANISLLHHHLQGVLTRLSLGATFNEACIMEDVDAHEMMQYIQSDPKLICLKRKAELEPILRAKEAVVTNLDDPKIAQWYLEKLVEEFKKDVTDDKEIRIKIQKIDEVLDLSDNLIEDGD